MDGSFIHTSRNRIRRSVPQLNDPYSLSRCGVVKQNLPASAVQNSQNQELLEKCSTLKQYSQFIDVVRKKKNAPEQYKEVIKGCINQNILSGYLREKGSEVVNMLVAEYNYEKDIRIKQEDAYEDGVGAGKMQDCIEICQQLGISMEKTLEIFQERFKINDTDAQTYLKKYWKK